MAVVEVKPGERPVESGMNVTVCMFCPFTIAWWDPQDQQEKNAIWLQHSERHRADWKWRDDRTIAAARPPRRGGFVGRSREG